MKFTIFTPTYNREETLINCYQSLCNSKFKDFEWIIVDDGSTDNTKERVSEWIKAKSINIRYFSQKNSGKHIAFNKAILEAKGEYFINLDSDDIMEIDSMNKINSLDINNYDNLMAICYLSKYQNVNYIIGKKFPKNFMYLNLKELTYKYKVNGDKLWVFITKILKQYKFPDIDGEKFITEGVLLYEMAEKYNILCINEVLQIKEYMPLGLTSIGNNKLFLDNPKGAKLYYRILLNTNPPIKYKLLYWYYFMKYYIVGVKNA